MNNVLLLRTIKGMTQYEFADFCGMSRISIARYEAGAEINRANALKIADACGVSISYVLGDQGTGSSPALTDTEQRLLVAFRNADDVYKTVALELLEAHQKEKSSASAS